MSKKPIAYSPITGNTFQANNKGGYLRAGDNNLSDTTAALMQAQLSKEMYDYQFDKENAYNDPSAQMARLQAAGLNPHLVYGDGASSQSASPGMSAPNVHGSATQMAQLRMQAAGQFSSQLMQVADFFTSQELKQAQIDQVRAQTANLNGRTFLLGDTHELNAAELLSRGLDYKFRSDSYETRLNTIEEGYNNLVADTGKKGAETELLGVQKDLTETQVAYYDELTSKVGEEIRNLGLEGILLQDKHNLNVTERQKNELENIVLSYKANLASQGIDPNQTIGYKYIEAICDYIGISPSKIKTAMHPDDIKVGNLRNVKRGYEMVVGMDVTRASKAGQKIDAQWWYDYYLKNPNYFNTRISKPK